MNNNFYIHSVHVSTHVCRKCLCVGNAKLDHNSCGRMAHKLLQKAHLNPGKYMGSLSWRIFIKLLNFVWKKMTCMFTTQHI